MVLGIVDPFRETWVSAEPALTNAPWLQEHLEVRQAQEKGKQAQEGKVGEQLV